MRYTNGIEIFNITDVDAMFPNVTFPVTGPEEGWLNGHNIYFLIETEAPEVDWDKIPYEDGVEEDSGEWLLKWSVRDKTPEELESYYAELAQGITAYRESLESTVVTYGDHSSYCDKESETGLNECINNIMDNGGEKTISWEGPNGYTVANLEGLSGLRKSVVDYRQKTRDAERLTLEAHGDTPFTSLENALSAFDGYMED